MYLPFLLAFLLVFPLVTIILNKKKYSKLPPGPSTWPIVGSLPEQRKNKPTYKWIARTMKQLASDIVCIRLGQAHVVVVSSAELAREFLQKNDVIFASRPLSMTSEYATFGYLTMGLTPLNQQWKKMRKMYVRELMSTARLRWLLEKRNDEADNLVRFIYNQCKKNEDGHGAVVDLRFICRHYCANVARKMTFSKRYFGEIQEDGGPGVAEKEYVDALFTLLEYMNSFCISDYLPWLRFLDIDGHEKIVRDATRVLEKYQNPIIEDRLNQFKDGIRKHPQDLLDVLITLKDESGEPLLSIDEIKAQCAELFFPCDNPSNAVEWIIAEMINQPDIMQHAVEEIDMVVGENRLVQETDIPQLNYLKACVREALRLHPVTPFNLPHVSTKDAIVAGYFIPKGSHVLLYRYLIGRHPDVWDNPSKFDPSRHIKNSETKVEITEPNLNFIAFSTGTRGCPAMNLGIEMTIMSLARLLQAFTWSLPSNEKTIDLSESSHELCLEKPLHARAKPRLSTSTYNSLV